LLLELAVGVTDALMVHDQRPIITIASDGLIEQIAHGDAEQWCITAAAGVTPDMCHDELRIEDR
jgi:hypothetical protein